MAMKDDVPRVIPPGNESVPESSATGYVPSSSRRDVGEIGEEARRAARKPAGEIRERGISLLESRKDLVFDGLGAVAEALRKAGEELRGREQARLADAAFSIAGRVDGFSTDLRSRGMDRLLADVEGYVRSRPGVALGGAFAAGLLIARLVKSSGRASGKAHASFPEASGEGGRRAA